MHIWYVGRGKMKKNVYRKKKFAFRVWLATVVFVLIMFLSLLKLPSTDHFLYHILYEDLPFAKIHQVYDSKVGIPFMFKGPDKQEALLATAQADQSRLIEAINGGVVLFVGQNGHHDKSIIIQHPDETKAIYKNIDQANVHLYEFINKGDIIASSTSFDDVNYQDIIIMDNLKQIQMDSYIKQIDEN